MGSDARRDAGESGRRKERASGSVVDDAERADSSDDVIERGEVERGEGVGDCGSGEEEEGEKEEEDGRSCVAASSSHCVAEELGAALTERERRKWSTGGAGDEDGDKDVERPLRILRLPAVSPTRASA
jgi:hypothetical protein